MNIHNKKGFAPIIGIIIAVAIGLVILFAGFGVSYKFLSSPSFMLTALGASFIILTLIYVVPKAMEGTLTKSKTKLISVFLLLGAVFIVVAQTGLVSQTFLGNSQFNSDDGKGYWLINGVADSIGDVAEFNVITPAKGILPDGTTVTPTKSLKISISKGEKQCEYLLTKKTASLWFGLFTKKEIIYYQLSSPERVIEAVFSDDRGNSFTIDGTTSQTKTFTDSDGKGTAVIKTVGALQGKYDCPEGNNVIVMKSSENPAEIKFDNPNQYLDAYSFNKFVDKQSGYFSSWTKKEVVNADQFITAWANGNVVISPDNSKVIGTGRELGNVQFVITADRDYFNSVVLTPAKPARPLIDSITVNKEMNQNSNSAVKVLISNAGEVGVVNIQISSPAASFTPSTTDITLGKTYTFSSNMKVTDKIATNNPINVKVCATSQLGGNTCDTKTAYFDTIKADGTVPDTCGNNVCDSFETKITCKVDCDIENPVTLVCDKWYQVNGVQVDKDYGTLGWRHLTGNPIVTSTPVCKTNPLVNYAILLVIAAGTIVAIFAIMKPSKRGRKRK